MFSFIFSAEHAGHRTSDDRQEGPMRNGIRLYGASIHDHGFMQAATRAPLHSAKMIPLCPRLLLTLPPAATRTPCSSTCSCTSTCTSTERQAGRRVPRTSIAAFPLRGTIFVRCVTDAAAVVLPAADLSCPSRTRTRMSHGATATPKLQSHPRGATRRPNSLSQRGCRRATCPHAPNDGPSA
eukprot:7383545-Prymnesium_polylepis.4